MFDTALFSAQCKAVSLWKAMGLGVKDTNKKRSILPTRVSLWKAMGLGVKAFLRDVSVVTSSVSLWKAMGLGVKVHPG